jgi:NitT/TauT family transport system substrate-binding protein
MLDRRSFLASAAAAGASAVARPAFAADMEKVVVAQAFQSLLYLPLYVGIDKGYFTKRGVDVTKVTAGSGANGIAQVLSGSATFSLQDPMTMVLANIKGASMKTVASCVDGVPAWIVVMKDSPIKTVADLKGKTIATAIPPSTSTYLLQRLLQGKNIAATTQTVLLGTEVAPLLAGKVDAAAVYEPYLEDAITQGARVLYEFSSSAQGGYAFSSFDALTSTIAARPKAVQAFVAGVDDAIKAIASDPAAATDVAIKEFPSLAPDIVRAGIKRMLREKVYPHSALVSPAAFDNALALQTSIGNIKPGAVSYAGMVDPTFAQKLAKS